MPLLILFLLFPSLAWGEPRVLTIPQGGVKSLTIPVAAETESVWGEFEKRRIPFFESHHATTSEPVDSNTTRSFTALIGIDMEQSPGSYPFPITLNGTSTWKLLYTIEVLQVDFKVQTLTLPKDKVDLDPETLTRVEKESARFKTLFAQESGQKRWHDMFRVPVFGEISGSFGNKRIINGQPKNPHTGVDIAAPMGENVVASHDGTVVLTGDFFFNGQSIVIDHGGGVMTMYFHLSKIAVKEGMSVAQGDVIGQVGQSGRATGPHLHWGARLHGARVDPFLLVKATSVN